MSVVRAVNGQATGIAMIDIDDKGQNAISLAPNANYALTFDMIQESWEKISDEIDLIVMQLETPLDVMKKTAKLGKESGKLVILNPAPAQSLDEEFLSFVDILVPNETETSIITGLPVDSEEECVEAAKELQERGVEKVILTLGSRGSLVVDADGSDTFVAPYEIEPVDTTGAGDAFIAGFAVALAQGETLVEAARLGNAAGALNATKLGAQGGLSTKAELDQFLAEKA
jgi:ribokinase